MRHSPETAETQLLSLSELRERTFVICGWDNPRAHFSAHTARSCSLGFLPSSHPNLWDPQLLFPSRSLVTAASGVSGPRRGPLEDGAPGGRGAPRRASALSGKPPHTLTPPHGESFWGAHAPGRRR